MKMFPNLHSNVIQPIQNEPAVMSSECSSVSTHPNKQPTSVSFNNTVEEVVYETQVYESQCYWHGLEQLCEVNQAFIKRIIRTSTRVALEEPNKYDITARSGRILYFAHERTAYAHTMTRCCTRPEPMELNVVQTNGAPVVHILIEPGFGGFYWNVTVTHKDSLIGRIIQEGSIFSPCFVVKDAKSNDLLKIKGQYTLDDWCTCPVARFRGNSTVPFEIFTPDGLLSLGHISKQPMDETQMTRNADFVLTFPMELDCGVKMLLIAASITMDIQIFPKQMALWDNCDSDHLCTQFAAISCFYVILISVIIFIIVVLTNK